MNTLSVINDTNSNVITTDSMVLLDNYTFSKPKIIIYLIKSALLLSFLNSLLYINLLAMIYCFHWYSTTKFKISCKIQTQNFKTTKKTKKTNPKKQLIFKKKSIYLIFSLLKQPNTPPCYHHHQI